MQNSQPNETHVHDHAGARRVLEAADPDEGPWPIHGVAVAAGDVLHDNDGNPVLMTAEELEKAQYSPAATKLTVDHPNYDGWSPPVEATVGNNSMSYSGDGEAVVYDATTHDDEIAAGVNGETYGVSVHAGFKTGEPDPETGIPVAEDIVFHDLSVVSVGDSPSNSAQYGGRSDVEAWARSGGLEAAISEGSAEGSVEAATDDDDPESLVRRLATRFGILNPNDTRGRIWFDDQTSDGEAVTVSECGFRGASWAVSIHRDGDEFPDVGEGLGPSLGASGPFGPGEFQADVQVELEESLDEDETLFALLRYHADGESSDPITSSDGAHFLESAFVGVAPDGATVEADAGGEQDGSRSGESGRGAASENMTDRNDHIRFLTANAGYDEDDLEGMSDSAVEQTRNLVESDDGGEDEEEDDTNNQTGGADTLGDMTVDQLGDALREQGFVTEDAVGEAVEASRSTLTQSDQVDEIIAESDDFGESDREELMASSPAVVETIHKTETRPGAAPIPGTGGARRRAEASIGDTDEHDLDDYGTGVSE